MNGFVYILYFKKTNRFYVGSTNYLARRLQQHANNHTYSTTRLGEFELAFFQEVENLKFARQVEHRIKSWKRRDYIERIVKDGKITFLHNMHP